MSQNNQRYLWPTLALLLGVCILASLAIGRYLVPLSHVGGILIAAVLPIEMYWTAVEARVVELIRLPRILLAAVAGAGLAISGAALQGIFRGIRFSRDS